MQQQVQRLLHLHRQDKRMDRHPVPSFEIPLQVGLVNLHRTGQLPDQKIPLRLLPDQLRHIPQLLRHTPRHPHPVGHRRLMQQQQAKLITLQPHKRSQQRMIGWTVPDSIEQRGSLPVNPGPVLQCIKQ